MRALYVIALLLVLALCYIEVEGAAWDTKNPIVNTVNR